MPKSTSPDLAQRKKMRKGTHSCFECRRRKIRCIFPPDNPDVCSECFARGSRCVDQEHANADVVLDQRKNLRERVSRLEALVENLLDGRGETSKSPSVERKQSAMVKSANLASDPIPYRDPFPPTPLSSEASSSAHGPIIAANTGNAPLLSVFEDALNNAESHYAKSEASCPYGGAKDNSPACAPEPLRVHCTDDHMIDETYSAASKLKRERAKQALVSVLPPYDQLTKILNANGDWWQTWRKKTAGTAGNIPLAQYAAFALSDEGSPGALGVLVLGLGVCIESDDVDKYINTVDRWVLADDEYASTLEGMECLILEAKWYSDVGQPRRAWLAFRRGLMYAQLMGLHRKRTTSEAHESIWWSLYHGDRFLCLLLGLPSGVADAHCDLTIRIPPAEESKYLAPLAFVNEISIIAGKVIDRNQGSGDPSFAFALDLDQKMEDLFSKLDPAWVDVSTAMTHDLNSSADLRERLLAQLVFHQIRVYLHLPFMLKSAKNPRFTYSRTVCLTGSREMLRLYQGLRTGCSEPLYECKAIDFLGFTAAILLILGLFNIGLGMSTGFTPEEIEGDWRLIEICIDIFRRASNEKGGKVAAQSYQVLEKMRTKLRDCGSNTACNDNDDCDDCPYDGSPAFVIPYFGTISIRRGDKTVDPPHPPGKRGKSATSSSTSPSVTQLTPSSSTDVHSFPHNVGMPADNFTHMTDPFVTYDGFYAGGSAFDTQLNEDGMSNFALPAVNLGWQSMPTNMDIDQDWIGFMNDAQTQMLPGVGQAPLDQEFAQNSFPGF